MKSRQVIAIVVVFVILVGLLTVGFVTTTNNLANVSGSLESVYQRNFYELLSNVNDIEVTLSKGLVSNDKTQQTKLFYKLYEQCNLAQSNLSRLPINHTSIKETTKFVNQMGGFSYYLFDKLNNGEALSEDDYKSLTELYSMCVSVSQILNEYGYQIQNDYSILKDANLKNSQIDGVFTSLQETGVDYPTLIYDGPFSDSVMNKEVKGLSGEEFNLEQANKMLEELFKDYNVKRIDYKDETNGAIATYNFNMTLNNNHEYYLQVAKKGGLILTISSYQSSVKDNYSLSDCEQKAEEFAKMLDLENIKAVWSTKINNIAYVNLTSVVNDTIIYPEMIKVKISADSGEIIGWEARSYAYNKSDRTSLRPTVTASKAREKVSSLLEIETEKKALIPLEYNREVLCYEFKCNYNGYTYYVYINADTLVEENVLRIVDTLDGNLIM
ncbi:MAG: germination protein YpeB [Christensenellales bacterium]